ncbi:GrpB family protein [Lacrimispora sp.]|uniref:GrpB family protein n=1 Tax=Lacrimispora sp. TaxID=2719234 RepID=UPI002FD889AB
MKNIENSHNSASANDEYLQKVTVGGLKLHNAPITLIEYDPHWPELFNQESYRIQSILGCRVLQLEHVGSTSIPGLCAKPIIDILLAVADSSDEPSYVPALETAGYTLRIREPDWFEHRLFKGPDTDINLHVFSAGASEAKRMLRFRDWLRTNDTDRENYARVKRDLAQHVWRNVQNYADAKTEVIKEIMERINSSEQ